MAKLRLSLTVSGAVALGAYEGGALAALLYATRPLAADAAEPVTIDVMSGASAGSITALLAARALLQGNDPGGVMSAAWVERDSIGALLAHSGDAPLSIDTLRSTARDLFDQPSQSTSSERQSRSVSLSYALAPLRGLEYRLPRLGREPVVAATYIDFYDHVLQPGDPVETLVTPPHASPLDAVLASAANAMGFPPYLLDRSAVWNVYLATGVDNLPDGSNRSLWFTDGGTINNEPLGRTLDLTNNADATADDDCRRLHLLIHPHPTGGVRDDSWAEPNEPPTFVQTAVRSLELQRTQSLYADLKHLEKTNTRISWKRELSTQLGKVLDQLPQEQQTQVRDALARAAQVIADEAQKLREQRSDSPVAEAPTSPDGKAAVSIANELDDLLNQVAGISGKSTARVDVISPLLLDASKTHSVEQLLSGEVLFHFGGFLDETMRRNDYDLGYASTLEWLSKGGLTTAGLPEDLSDKALEAATTAYRPNDGWKETGATTVGSLLRMHPWQTARVAGKFTHVLLHDFVHRSRS